MYVEEKWKKIIQFGKMSWTKGGFLSVKSGGFLFLPILQKNIPFYYPKLLHPVRGIDNEPLENLER